MGFGDPLKGARLLCLIFTEGFDIFLTTGLIKANGVVYTYRLLKC